MAKTKKKYEYTKPITISFSFSGLYEDAVEDIKNQMLDEPEEYGLPTDLPKKELEELAEDRAQQEYDWQSFLVEQEWEGTLKPQFTRMIKEAQDRAYEKDKDYLWYGKYGRHDSPLEAPSSFDDFDDVLKLYYEHYREIEDFEVIEAEYKPKQPYLRFAIGSYFYVELLVQGTQGYTELVEAVVEEDVYSNGYEGDINELAEQLSRDIEYYWFGSDLPAELLDYRDEDWDDDVAREFVETAFREWLGPADLVTIEERYGGFGIKELQTEAYPPPKSVLKLFQKLHHIDKLPPLKE